MLAGARHLIFDKILNFILFHFHRHMKIHVKGPNGAPAARPVSPSKRRKAPKRKLSTEDDTEKINEPPNKKVQSSKLSCILFAVAWILLFNTKMSNNYITSSVKQLFSNETLTENRIGINMVCFNLNS